MIPAAHRRSATRSAPLSTASSAVGMLAQGPEVAGFEQEFSAIVAGRECVALNSGTSALHMMFLAAGIGPGDEIIVPSFSFAATANAVALTGATPVFADIDPDDLLLSTLRLRNRDHVADARRHARAPVRSSG